MRIGELAEQTGVTTKTVRFYEQVGVLPIPARRPSGYREYGGDSIGRLEFVRAAQAVGLSLGEIREVLSFRDRGEMPCEHVAGLIARRAADLDLRIAELTRVRDDLRRLARRAKSLDPRQCDPARVCHVIVPSPPPGRRDVTLT